MRVSIGKSLVRLCGNAVMLPIALAFGALWGLGTRGGDIWPR